MSFASSPISFRPSSTALGDLPAAAFCAPAAARSSSACLRLFRPLPPTPTSSLQCNAASRHRTQEYIEVIKNGLPVIKWHEIVEDDEEKDSLKEDKIRELVGVVRSMLQSMDDGEISISPYDTAWVALVSDGAAPQFPSSLDWISSNQLPDGSWGDDRTFSIFDRIINTLACVVALTSWNRDPLKTQRELGSHKCSSTLTIATTMSENKPPIEPAVNLAAGAPSSIALNYRKTQNTKVATTVHHRRQPSLCRKTNQKLSSPLRRQSSCRQSHRQIAAFPPVTYESTTNMSRYRRRNSDRDRIDL